LVHNVSYAHCMTHKLRSQCNYTKRRQGITDVSFPLCVLMPVDGSFIGELKYLAQ